MNQETRGLTEDQSAIVEEETFLLARVQSALTLQALPEEQRSYHDDIIELRDSISDARTEDLPAILAHMERLVLLAQQQQKIIMELPANRLNPYFAHIRLQEGNRKRDILIGSNHYNSEDLIYPIIDWKHAPISQIYYRYQEGEDFYEDFGNRNMEGILLVRRTITIDEGKLLRIDTGVHNLIQTSEGWQHVERIVFHLRGGSGTAIRPATIGGASFNSGLERRARSRDKYLQEITALIDPEQFEVITRPESGIVVIEGGAGSGKTTVALHRLAYLVALKPNHFVPSRMMTVVFNKAMANYISKVLPALGIEKAQSWVYPNWTSYFRRRYFPQLPKRYTEQTPVSVVEVKRHPVMLQWLKNKVQEQESDFLRQLDLVLPHIPEKEIALQAWHALSNRPLARRILLFDNWSRGQENISRIPACEHFIVQTRIQHLIEESFSELPEHPTSLAVTIWEEAFLRIDELSVLFAELAPHTFTRRQLEEVRDWAVRKYEQRHGSERELERMRQLSDTEAGTILESTAPAPQLLDEEDDTLLLLLYQMTLGPFRGRKNKQIRYPHILVDEAQDFSPVELQLLLNTTPDDRQSVTFAGDFDQQIMVGSQLNSWSEALKHLGLSDTATASLKIGYRSSHEIIEVAKAIIGPMSVNQEWNAVRHGGPVELFRFQNHGHLVTYLATSLIETVLKEPTANVAILTRFGSQADLIYEGLLKADVPQLRRVRDQDFSFAPGIEISDIFQVKGLEFDYVVLIDVDEQTFPDDAKARHLLYVGVTRAAHQLWVMTCRDPSPLLPLDLLREIN